MIAAGKHTAVATGSFDLGTSDKGTEQIAVEFEIVDGEHAGEMIAWYGFFTEKTTDRTLESLRYSGWQGDDVTTLDGLGSRKVTLVVEHEPDQEGKLRAKVRWINRFGGTGVKLKNPMNDADRSRFASRMRAFAKSKPALPPEDGPAPSARHQEPAVSRQEILPPPHGDDEIPF